jgi:UDP-glucose 4-epimerase
MKQKMKRILVTGGAGYVGSHMVRVLVKKGFEPVVFDNLSTGHRAFVPDGVRLIKGDLRNKSAIERVFQQFSFDAVMHFAGLISVGESVKKPKLYEQNNVTASVHLVDAMQAHGVHRLIFSSTAAVYGAGCARAIRETARISPVNPYGKTKALVEAFLKERTRTSNFRYVSLRYFNAAGAIDTAEIGEQHDPETHLIPCLLKAVKKNRPFHLFGSDYATKDGTCIRDYIHVMDLCEAHYLALTYLLKNKASDCFNLGTGKGYSVREIVRIVERVVGRNIKVCLKPRRSGDALRLVACASKARRVLGWKAARGIEEIIRSAWRWHGKG